MQVQLLTSFPVYGEGGMARSDMTEGGRVVAAWIMPVYRSAKV